MIDFKYHVVSLIAVFLAVALGIVIGTTALNGGIVENLGGQVSTLQDDKRALEGRVTGLENQVGSNSTFDASVAPQLVANTLTDQTFVTFTVGSGVTSDDRDAVITMLQDAGAKQTGAISLTDTYTDPKQANALFNYATSNQPTGVTLAESTTPGEAVGSLLAALLVNSASTPDVPETEITTVLSGLASLGAINVDSETAVTQATSFVIITRGTQTNQAGDRNKILLALAKQLDAAGGAVVIAGDPDSNGAGGLVNAARADASFEALVSTVDNSNYTQGQIATAWAIPAEIGGVSGRYGIGDGAKPAPPQPKPTTGG